MNFASDLPSFWQLIWRATWQAGILACLVFCVIFLLQRWISPKWRALLWTVPLIRLVLLIIPASGLSLFQFFELETNRVIRVTDVPKTAPADIALHTSSDSQLSIIHNSEQTRTALVPGFLCHADQRIRFPLDTVASHREQSAAPGSRIAFLNCRQTKTASRSLLCDGCSVGSVLLWILAPHYLAPTQSVGGLRSAFPTSNSLS